MIIKGKMQPKYTQQEGKTKICHLCVFLDTINGWDFYLCPKPFPGSNTSGFWRVYKNNDTDTSAWGGVNPIKESPDPIVIAYGEAYRIVQQRGLIS